jgi:serine/threonine protein kinase
MVIKETKTFRPSQWRDPKNWRHRLPQEIRIHELLEERRATDPAMCRHVVRSRGHRLWMKARRYRLYLDYHAGGDINRAMGLCASNWRKKERANESIVLPEGFVWYTIKALATACLVLHEGTTAEEPVDGWRPITHLDLHLPNVLLDVSNHPVWGDKGKSAQGSSKSAEPSRADATAAGTNSQEAKDPPVVPILADFGISFFSPENECLLADNPDDYVLYETDTRYAPVSCFLLLNRSTRQLIAPRKCNPKTGITS